MHLNTPGKAPDARESSYEEWNLLRLLYRHSTLRALQTETPSPLHREVIWLGRLQAVFETRNDRSIMLPPPPAPPTTTKNTPPNNKIMHAVVWLPCNVACSQPSWRYCITVGRGRGRTEARKEVQLAQFHTRSASPCSRFLQEIRICRAKVRADLSHQVCI